MMPSVTQTFIAGLLAVGAAAFPAVDSATDIHFAHGADGVPEELIAAYKAFDDAEATGSPLGRRGEHLIDLYMHVIQHPTERENDPSDEALEEQVKVLNDAFLPSHFQFVLKNISHTVDEGWFRPETGRGSDQMRKRLRQGGKDALNLFMFEVLQPEKNSLEGSSTTAACYEYENGTVSCAPVQTTPVYGTTKLDALGTCNYPGKSLDRPDQLVLDGCSIDIRALPRGKFPDYGTGKAAVHEVGHWLGLAHPFPDYYIFPNGTSHNESYPKICDPSLPEQVADLPVCYLDVELLEPNACPQTDIDTCPDYPGKDPIHNHMHYTSDICRTEFTPGQTRRMEQMYNHFRSTGAVATSTP